MFSNLLLLVNVYDHYFPTCSYIHTHVYLHAYVDWGMTDVASFRTLVVWLEETKIRLYTPDQRAHLRQIGCSRHNNDTGVRNDGNNDNVANDSVGGTDDGWDAHLLKYLHDLNPSSVEASPPPVSSAPQPPPLTFPLPLSGEHLRVCLSWLLAQAVSAEYHDNNQTFNRGKCVWLSISVSSASYMKLIPRLSHCVFLRHEFCYLTRCTFYIVLLFDDYCANVLLCELDRIRTTVGAAC